MASLSQPNSYINALIDVAGDSMSNLFYVKFVSALTDSDSTLETGLRVRTNDFSFSGFTQDTYTVNYMTTSMNFPSASYTGTKEFSLNIRVDSAYEVYTFLMQQMARTSSPNLSFASNYVPSHDEGGLEVYVYALTSPLTDEAQMDPTELDDQYTMIYHFKYCWVKSITGLNYSYDGSTPLTVTANLAFLDLEDLQNTLPSNE